MVDWTRQVFANFCPLIYDQINLAFKTNDTVDLRNNVKLFMEVMQDLDSILATDKRSVIPEIRNLH